jgi:hypothetical protein
MAAPATMGTGAEPEQPEPILDEAGYEGLGYEGSEYEGLGYEPYSPVRRIGWPGIVVLFIAVLAVAAAAYALIHHPIKPKIQLTYQPAAVFNLRVGDCFNGQNNLGVTVLPCSSPHAAEVFATFTLPSGAWPGDAAAQAAAQAGCEQRIAGYMNPQLATNALSQEYIYPNQMTWAAGARTVICDVRSVNGLITGSVRQSPDAP